jgi:hypothetical protein
MAAKVKDKDKPKPDLSGCDQVTCRCWNHCNHKKMCWENMKYFCKECDYIRPCMVSKAGGR